MLKTTEVNVMKRFVYSILVVTVFFLGVGALVERTGARFKSDEKALELIRKARIAIGGESAIANIQSMRITGKTTQNIKLNGVDKSETGETEIAFMLPDKMMKTVKIGDGNGTAEAHQVIERRVDVVRTGDAKDKMEVTVNAEGGANGGVKKIIIKKDDGTVQELTGADAEKFITKEDKGAGGERRIVVTKGDGSTEEKVIVSGEPMKMRSGGEGNATFTTKDGKTIVMTRDGGPIEHGQMMAMHHDGMKQNEMLRTTLGLLLTAPQGMDVEYTFGGTGDVDGRSCNIVVASFAGQSYKLFLDSSSNMPVALNYTGSPMPKVFTFTKKSDGTEPAGTFTAKVAAPADGGKDVVFFTKADGGDAHATVEYQVKFSDFRSTGGVQLPYKWTQTAGGVADETFEVTSYDINPANIADQFKGDRVMVRTAKPDNK